jgi:FkbM family methyltransferase
MPHVRVAAFAKPADTEMDRLLFNENVVECQSREQDEFDTLTVGHSGLVLFGAGGLGRKVLRALRANGIAPLAFADNKLAGQSVEGVEVLTPPEAAFRFGQSATFVVAIWSSWADTMQQQMASLRALGCRNVVSFIPLLWKYSGLLPHTQIDLPSRVLEQKDELYRCFDLWADEDSRQEFLCQLRWRLRADFCALRPPVADQYWQRDLIKLGSDAVFVDAGAFDGDTLAQFVRFTEGRFRKAYAFEPDPANFQSLERRLDQMPQSVRCRVQVFRYAVGDKRRDLAFHGGEGAGSTAGAGDEVVKCVALDDVLPEPPDLIKYDIEGYELAGLSGTRQIIADRQPNLIVCVYHLQDHLWRIPLLIHSFNPNYRFYLRPHGQIWDTVCYAIPR